MSQVISQGFENIVKVHNISAIKPTVLKDQNRQYQTVSIRNVSMDTDDVVGFRETVENLNIRIMCSSLDELRSLGEWLLKMRSTNTPFYVATGAHRQRVQAAKSYQSDDAYVQRSEEFDAVSLYWADQIISQDTRISSEINKSVKPDSKS